MLPVRDDLEVERPPVVSLALLVSMALLWLVVVGMGDAAVHFYQQYAVVPAAYRAGDQPWFAPISSVFLHGGWLHVVANMIFLWIVGDDVEERLGHIKFLALFLLSGAAAAYAQIFAGPDSLVPMVGASGGIAGILAAFWMLHPRAKIETIFPSLPLVLAVMLLNGAVIGLVAMGIAGNAILVLSGLLTLGLLALSVVTTLVTADWIFRAVPAWIFVVLLALGALGVAGGMWYDLLNPFETMGYLVGIGLTGAFLAVASFVLRRSRSFLSSRVQLRAPVFVLLWFAYNVAAGLLWLRDIQGAETVRSDGGVAYWAHVGGFLAGIMLTAVLAPGYVRSRVLRWGLASLLGVFFAGALAITFFAFPI